MDVECEKDTTAGQIPTTSSPSTSDATDGTHEATSNATTSTGSAISDNASDISNDMPANQETSLQKRLNRYKVRLTRSNKKLEKNQVITKAALVNELRNYLPKRAHEFVTAQINQAGRAPSGRRFDDSTKSFALQMKGISPKAYTLMRKIFKLPSFVTIAQILDQIDIRPGFHPAVCDALKAMKWESDNDKYIVIPFDEMGLKSNITYDSKIDQVEGLADFGDGETSEDVANHAGVFIARGITGNWKQPFGYFLTRSTMTPKMLADKVVEGVRKMLGAGLRPLAVVMDQGANNQAAYKLLGVTSEKPYFYVDDIKIYALYDPPHLLKNIRNNFKSKGFIVDEKPVRWEHVVQLYNHDQSKPIRMVPKLKGKHLELPAFSSMSVPLAAQVGC